MSSYFIFLTHNPPSLPPKAISARADIHTNHSVWGSDIQLQGLNCSLPRIFQVPLSPSLKLSGILLLLVLCFAEIGTWLSFCIELCLQGLYLF